LSLSYYSTTSPISLGFFFSAFPLFFISGFFISAFSFSRMNFFLLWVSCTDLLWVSCGSLLFLQHQNDIHLHFSFCSNR
ncbi:hypothetical protein PHAVU_009G170200, partial [Phaseolus vulgaris]